MPRKIYKYNQPNATATFILYANEGKLAVKYKFEHGNPIANVPARLALESEFAQNLLENSPIFKKKIVVLEKVINDGEPAAKTEKTVKHIEEVKNISEAIDYLANTYGLVCKTAKAVKDTAAKKGIDFPNLEEE
jgi:hypothetical protein